MSLPTSGMLKSSAAQTKINNEYKKGEEEEERRRPLKKPSGGSLSIGGNVREMLLRSSGLCWRIVAIKL